MRLPSRRSFLKTLAGSAVSLAALGGYAFAVEPGFRLRVQRYAFTPPGWPRDFPLTIAALADIHVGEPHMSLDRVAAIVEATNALGADLIVLLGDYAGTDRISRPRLMWSDVIPELAALKAPLGIFAILGNHEWWDDPFAQRLGRGPTLAHKALAASGIPLLENDARRLLKGDRAFWLLGLGDQIAFIRGRRRFSGVDDLPGTLAKVKDGAPAILLAHEPDIFPNVPARVSLTLSGHTHGGQVRLFGWSPVVPSAYGNRYAYGHVIERDRHLVVSGGLGTVSAGLAPVRFGVPPEIVLIELGQQPGSPQTDAPPRSR
jgi:predicted MPP superfamily phosphohydrolase